MHLLFSIDMDTDTRRLVSHKRKNSSSRSRRAAPLLRAACLLDLPDELLLAIFRLLSPAAWRFWSHADARVVNLRETCTRFNAVLDLLVTRLWVTNTSTVLTVADACGKIQRCSSTLTSLTLYRLYPATAAVHDSMVDAINACHKVRTLCLTPGTGSPFVAQQFASMTRVKTFVMIPNSVAVSTFKHQYTREQDGESIAIFEQLYSSLNVPEMVVWRGAPHNASCHSRDPALASQLGRMGEVAKLFWVDSLNSTQAVMSAREYSWTKGGDPGDMCSALRLGEFTTNECATLDMLTSVDRTIPAGLQQHAVFLHESGGLTNGQREPIYLSRIINVVISPAMFLADTLRLIAPALGRSITVWVPFMGVEFARKHVHRGVAVAPMWFIRTGSWHLPAPFDVSSGVAVNPF